MIPVPDRMQKSIRDIPHRTANTSIGVSSVNATFVPKKDRPHNRASAVNSKYKITLFPFPESDNLATSFQKSMYSLIEHFKCNLVVASLRDDDIHIFFSRFNKLLMHELHRGQILGDY